MSQRVTQAGTVANVGRPRADATGARPGQSVAVALAGARGLAAGRPRREDGVAVDLRRAAVEVISAKGYADASVADLIGVAGISRATFYARYDSKEQCALAAAREIAASTIGRLGAAGPRARQYPPLGEIIGRLLAFAAERPSAARFMLVELPAIGAAGVAQRERMRDLYAALVSSAVAPQAVPRERQGVGRAVVGALERIAIARLHGGRAAALPGLAPALTVWAGSYRPLAERALAPSRGLPATHAPGRAPGTLGARVKAAPRDRVLDAVATIAATDACEALTTRAIVRVAGVSLRTFYEEFESVDAALAQALGVGLRRALELARAASATEEQRERRVFAATHALAGFLSAEPAFAQLALVEAQRAGAAGESAQQWALDSLAGYLASEFDAPSAALAAPLAAEASAAAAFELCAQRARAGRAHELRRFADRLGLITLVPLVGVRRALTALPA